MRTGALMAAISVLITVSPSVGVAQRLATWATMPVRPAPRLVHDRSRSDLVARTLTMHQDSDDSDFSGGETSAIIGGVSGAVLGAVAFAHYGHHVGDTASDRAATAFVGAGLLGGLGALLGFLIGFGTHR